jgi:hypothetical protein
MKRPCGLQHGREIFVKNTIKLFGFIAIVAVMGFTMAGCSSPTGPDGGGDGDNTGGAERYIALTVQDFKMFDSAPWAGQVAVYADSALTQPLAATGVFPLDDVTQKVALTGGNATWTGSIADVPKNNTVHAVVLANGMIDTDTYWAPKVFELELGSAAAGESIESPKELSVTFGNVVTKTVTVSYDFTINGATPAHSGIEYMKPRVGFYFEVPGLEPLGFDLGEVVGYSANSVEMTVPDFGTLPFPIHYSAFAYAEGAPNPTIKTFTTGGPVYTASDWSVVIGEITQTITGTVNVASFDIDTGVYTSVSVTIFTAGGEDLGNGTIASGAFSIMMTSANTERAAYAMVIGSYYDMDTNTTRELVRYSTAFSVPALSDPNQSVGALTYDGDRIHPAVTFNLNGGNVGGDTDDVIVSAGSNFTIDTRHFPEPERIVHLFTEWNTKADGSGERYNGEAISSDITVYAQWYFSPITVTFNANGGLWRSGGADPELETNTSGFINTLPAVNPVRNGNRFDGWNTKADGSGATFTTTTLVTWEIATVYAQWVTDPSVIVATVTFNANGGRWGSDTVKTQILLGGETPVTPEDPTTAKPFTSPLIQLPTGATLSSTLSEGLYRGAASVCTFDGWNTQADGNGSAYTPSPASTSINVYAKWKDPENPEWTVYKYDVSAMSGANFWEKAWGYIDANAGDYIIMLGSDVSSERKSLNDGRSVILVGAGGRRTVSRSGNGWLLFVDINNAKLTLDYNITLQGHGSNILSLVYLAWDFNGSNTSEIVMNEGAVITGNTSSGSNGAGVNVGGTFTMNGGTISGNISTNSDTGSGGGVAVFGGTFIMKGGTISGNTSAGSGGGVNVNSGTIRIINGTIYGNSEDDTSLRNTATSSGASLFLQSSAPITATYGTEASGGSSGGNLSTRNTTIRVVNGVMN